MVRELDHFSFKKALDAKVYRNALLLGIFIALILFITDLLFNIIHPSIIAYPVTIVIFLFFYAYNKRDSKSDAQFSLLSVFLFIIIDLAWLLGDGSTIINMLVYFLFIVFTIIIIREKYINYLVLFIILNLAGVAAIEVFLELPINYFDNTIEAHPFVIGYSFVVMGSSLILLLFFRERFDQEGEILRQKSLELNQLAKDVEEKNAKLLHYNEELKLLNDSIQTKNIELDKKREKIVQVKDNLEKRVQRRTMRLEKRNQEQDLIFYQSSHDFRRPLTSLLGLNEFGELVATGESKNLLRLVGQTANEMDSMLQKFLMLYRINHYKEKDEGLTIAEIIDSIKNSVNKEGGTIEFKRKNLKKDLKLKKKYLIKAILDNLVENAIINRKPDEPPRIKIALARMKEEYTITVKDYGLGIPLEYHDKIYEMYFKGSSKSNGNGLGLYVVKRAIDALNGTIKLDSIEEKFTKFTITFKSEPDEV